MEDKQKQLFIKIIIFLLIFLAIMLLALSYQVPLYNSSINMIVHIQSKHNSSGIIEFQKLVSAFGINSGFIAIGLTYAWASRPRAYYYILLYSIQGFIVAITKTAYHRPRPYMTSLEVQTFGGCSSEYGQPSGHSVMISSVMVTLFLDLFFSKNCLYKKVNKLIFILCLIVDVGIIFLVGYSRLFLSMHSLDEIILGYQVGVWVAFFMHYVIKDYLFQNISQLLYEPLNIQNSYYIKLLVLSTCISATMFICEVIDYEFENKYFQIPQEWITNLGIHCHLPNTLTSFQDASLQESAACWIGYSAYLGILFESKVFKGQIWYIQKNILKGFGRLIVMCVLMLPIVADMFYYNVQDGENPFMIMFAQTFVPVMGCGFILLAFSDKINQMLHLDDRKYRDLYDGQNEGIQNDSISDVGDRVTFINPSFKIDE